MKKKRICIIYVRLSKDLYQLLEKVCELRGEGISSFTRRSLKLELGRLGFLSEQEKKSLGLKSLDNSLTKPRA